MAKSLIKVLQVNANIQGYGGVSEFLFNVYKNIDKDKVKFDFLSPNKTTYGIYKNEINKMGGDLYELNIEQKKFINKILMHRKLSEFLKENKYDIIHINSGSFFFNLQVAYIAKRHKIERIIVHSHNTLNKKNKIKNFIIKMLKPLLSYYATDFLACSEKAAKDMFTKKILNTKVIIIKNGIDVKKFKFDQLIRDKMRKKLNIDDKFVICNVGRFVEQKNHKFMIDCFKEVYNKNKNAILILIGQGNLENDIKEKVLKFNLEENVKFLGLRKDVNQIMQAADVFFLPSLFEGLPIVGIEAQTTGLKCVMSDTITKEVDITNTVKFLNLKSNTLSEWANELLKDNKVEREKEYEKIIERGYDIENTANTLLKIYMQNN